MENKFTIIFKKYLYFKEIFYFVFKILIFYIGKKDKKYNINKLAFAEIDTNTNAFISRDNLR